MNREMRLACVELTPFAGAHDLGGVHDRGGPIEPLSKCVADEGAWRRVVTAYAGVDVPNQLSTFGDRDTPLQNP